MILQDFSDKSIRQDSSSGGDKQRGEHLYQVIDNAPTVQALPTLTWIPCLRILVQKKVRCLYGSRKIQYIFSKNYLFSWFLCHRFDENSAPFLRDLVDEHGYTSTPRADPPGVFINVHGCFITDPLLVEKMFSQTHQLCYLYSQIEGSFFQPQQQVEIRVDFETLWSECKWLHSCKRELN